MENNKKAITSTHVTIPDDYYSLSRPARIFEFSPSWNVPKPRGSCDRWQEVPQEEELTFTRQIVTKLPKSGAVTLRVNRFCYLEK
jgi:hypothetical protein